MALQAAPRRETCTGGRAVCGPVTGDARAKPAQVVASNSVSPTEHARSTSQLSLSHSTMPQVVNSTSTTTTRTTVEERHGDRAPTGAKPVSGSSNADTVIGGVGDVTTKAIGSNASENLSGENDFPVGPLTGGDQEVLGTVEEESRRIENVSSECEGCQNVEGTHAETGALPADQIIADRSAMLNVAGTSNTTVRPDTMSLTLCPSTTDAVVTSAGASLTSDVPVAMMNSESCKILQDTAEMAKIADMLNEREFVSITQRRLEQMQQLLLSRSVESTSEVIDRIAPIQEPPTQHQDVPSEVSPENGAQQQEGAELRAETDGSISNASNSLSEEEGTGVETEADLEIVEDHFVLDSEGGGDAVGEGTIEDVADTATSPPSVGGLPSSTPPPTYAECMKNAIPLSFIDFWPQCTSLNDENFLYSRFETFDRIVEAANLWLQEHPNIVIRNCETTEIKASSLDEYILHTAAKASTFRSSFRPLLYVRGLRIWYSSKIINKLPFVFAVTPCVLKYNNIKPSLVNVGDHLEYEAFPALIEKCNDVIQDGRIKGRILNVESVCIKESDSEDDGRIHLFTDPDESAWRDSYSKTARYVLRVFYLPEQQAMEKLIFKDFLPEKSRSSRNHPKYRDFTTIMDDCRLWLVHLSSQYRVINAQTLEVKHVARKPSDTHATFCSDYEGAPRVRYLRVYYAEDLTDASVEFGAPLLSHKTFIPAVLKKRRHETLASLMHRVETWLRATGATVVCAETLTVLQQVCTDKKDADFSLYRSEWMEANTEYDHETLLYVVRVYLDTVYPEPPPQIFLDGEEETLDDDCCIL